ncbi:Fe-S cluster assembly protein SufD [bacterium]|nr:Fe-S cluster assembly protein SufD [bacterium]
MTIHPDPSSEARLGALDRIGEIGYPTKRDEAWRHAPHRALGELTFGPPVAPGIGVPAELDNQIPVLEGPRVVVVNGSVDASLSNLAGLDGLRLSSLAEVLAERPEQVAAHFEQGDSGIADVFVALNVAYGADGAVVQVADGVVLDVPIHIVDVGLPAAAQNATCTGVLIDIGVGSSATVIETRVGAGSEFGGSNIRTTIALADDSTLEHVLLQDVPSVQVHLSRVDVTQRAGSVFKARSFNLGAAYGRIAYNVQLAGTGAHADLSGLFFGFGDQTLDQQVNVVHAAAGCTSRQTYRGVLDEESTGVFNGGIDVRPGADGTDAVQSNDNLLLSDRAAINTQPRLEILADEVACKHGATVGQLDETALYYLRSRGIAADEARRLLINGFADQAVDDVGIETVRAWIIHRLGHDHA